MDQQNNELAFSNLRVLQCYTGTCVVLLTAYLVEYFKGNRSLDYLGIFVLFLALPLIVCSLLYFKSKDSKQIKYVILVGFSIFYMFILFTTENIFTSVFVIPMIIITQMYQDKRFSFRIGAAASLINIISVVINVLYHKRISATDIQNYEVQIAVILLVAIYNCVSTSVLVVKEKNKITAIQEEKETVTNIMGQSKVSVKNVNTQLKDIIEILEKIRADEKISKESIETIIDSSFSFMEVVQAQVDMTKEITSLTDETKELFDKTNETFKETLTITQNGSKNMLRLRDKSTENKQIEHDVSDNMSLLIEHSMEASKILEMIGGITKQTNLLSLNASIEAARVGEHGKGFAVVAMEIQKLAKETADATMQITDILTELNNYTNSASSLVNTLVRSNKEQFEIANNVISLFENIEKSVKNLSEDIELQYENINTINSYNNEINQGVENISVFTEDLWTKTEDTKKSSDSAIEGVETIHTAVARVYEEVHALHNAIAN